MRIEKSIQSAVVALLLFIHQDNAFREISSVWRGIESARLHLTLHLTREERIAEVYQNFERNIDPAQIKEGLNSLKLQNIISLWASNADQVSLLSGKQLSSESVQIKRKLQKTLRQIHLPTQKVYQFSFLSVLALLSIWFGLLANSSWIPQSFKNSVGLFVLSYPFVISALAFAAPQLVVHIYDRIQSLFVKQQVGDSNAFIEDDRTFYHEAAHFLVSYVTGIPVTNYQINTGSSIEISFATNFPVSIEEKKRNDNFPADIEGMTREEILKLLPVAFAGIVVELLKYGNVKGGLEDFTLALLLTKRLQQIAPSEDQSSSVDLINKYLVWAYQQAETIITKHPDILQRAVEGMKNQSSLPTLVVLIENNE